MNQVASLGLILLVSLLAGHLVKFARIPEVTGYILAGLLLGPSGLGWIGKDNVAGLTIFSEVALGLILFSIGSIFQFQRFRSIRQNVVKVTLIDAGLVFVLVTGMMLLLRQGFQASLILGIIAIETAAASTLMVLREYNASGPLTENLIGMIAINNVVCLTAFSLLVSLITVSESWSHASGSLITAIYRPVFLLVWQLVGSVALGYLIGVLLSSWATKVVEHGETLILLIGCLLLCIGLAVYLELSTLVTSLTIGATAANFSRHSRRLSEVQSRTDPPLYAIFFVIAGANLHVGLLKTLGVVGIAYVIARGIGKYVAANLGGRLTDIPETARRGLRYSTLPHAGLAIGLVLSLKDQLPQLEATVSTVVLAAILVYELIGPLSTRLALVRSGEVHARTEEAEELS
ncbi:MAG: cation:proton antiporter [Acidobacteriaceae bacterium]